MDGRFFVQQIARLLAGSPAGADQRVPAAVGEAVNRRIARLPQATARLLDVAAVVGSDVDATLLAAATGTPYPEVVESLQPAVAARVLRSEALGRYQFEHDLYRETRCVARSAPGRRPRARGASLTPSPTMIVGADFCSACTMANFSARSRSG